MNSTDLQFRTILHHYTFRDSFLVYHKKEDCFYTVGNLSKLDEKEYETHTVAIAQKVKEFIQKNHNLLDKDLMSEMAKRLDSRIGKINQRTKGLVGLFTLVYYLLNPYSQDHLKRQKQSLEKLKKTVDDALAESKENEIIVDSKENVRNDFSSLDTDISTERLSKSSEKEELEEIFTDETTYPKTPISTRLASDDLETPFAGEFKNNLIPSLPAKAKTPGRPSSKSVLAKPVEVPASTDPFLSPPPPPPPPPPPGAPGVPLPPPAPSFTTPASTLLPSEPEPLTFDPRNYTKLSKDEVSKQITAIEEYIEASEQALKPLNKSIDKHALLKPRLDELKLRINEYNLQLKECVANLERLKQAEKEDAMVELFFKSTKGYTDIPFYPDSLYQKILDRNQDLEKEHLENKKKLQQKITNKNELLKQLKKKSEEKSSKTTDSLLSQIEEAQSSIDELESQLSELSKINFLDKKSLPECLKFSHVIPLLQTESQNFEKQIIALKTEEAYCQNELKKLSEDCQKKHKMSLSALESLLDKKTKNLDNWTRNKNARVSWLKQPTGAKTAIFSPPKDSDPSKLSPLFEEYPFLISLTQLPQNINVMLRSENLKKENSGDPLSDFNAKIYGQLRAKKE